MFVLQVRYSPQLTEEEAKAVIQRMKENSNEYWQEEREVPEIQEVLEPYDEIPFWSRIAILTGFRVRRKVQKTVLVKKMIECQRSKGNFDGRIHIMGDKHNQMPQWCVDILKAHGLTFSTATGCLWYREFQTREEAQKLLALLNDAFDAAWNPQEVLDLIPKLHTAENLERDRASRGQSPHGYLDVIREKIRGLHHDHFKMHPEALEKAEEFKHVTISLLDMPAMNDGEAPGMSWAGIPGPKGPQDLPTVPSPNVVSMDAIHEGKVDSGIERPESD